MKSYWNNAELYKPPIDQKDKFRKDHQYSERVVVWLEGMNIAYFATYFHKIDSWGVEGCTNIKNEQIKWWQFVTNPYT